MRAEDSKIKVMAVMRKRSYPSEETKLYPKEDGKEEEMPISIVRDKRSALKKEMVTGEERKQEGHVEQIKQDEETKKLAVYSISHENLSFLL